MTPVYKLSASSIKGRTNYGSMLAGNTAYTPPVPAFESIATVAVGAGGSSTITFSSIPSDYTHLQVRAIARSTRTENNGYIVLRFNSDSGNNYVRHNLGGSGSSAYADATTSTSSPTIYYMAGASAGANIFGAFVLDILDYKNTNKYKTLRALHGNDRNGAGDLALGSGLWQNTNAITSITITEFNGFNWAQYSHFALYGIKGA